MKKSYIPKVKTLKGKWIYDEDKRFKTKKEASEYAYEDWYMDDTDWYISSGSSEFTVLPNIKLVKEKYGYKRKDGRYILKKL